MTHHDTTSLATADRVEGTHTERARSAAGHTQQLGIYLQAASHGDHVAFAALYDDTVARVYGLAFRVLRTSAQAEEVVQESYLEIWRTAARFDPERGSALAWILTTVHHRAVDRLRSEQARARREATYDGVGLTLLRSDRDPTCERALSRTDADRVRGALLQLTTRQREALELAYFGGCTHAQVATRTGVPLGTAKSRLRDGLGRLRDLLSDQPVAEPTRGPGVIRALRTVDRAPTVDAQATIEPRSW